MRFTGLTAIGMGACLAATAADAQGLGRKRGNQDQQSSGYEQVRKREEKKFPLGQSWIATSMNGKTFGGGERPSVAIDDHFRVRGFGGCNSFSATAFPLREQGIAVGPLAMTKRACDKAVMASELAFFTALRTAAKWDTQIGTLIVKGPNGELKFERSL